SRDAEALYPLYATTNSSCGAWAAACSSWLNYLCSPLSASCGSSNSEHGTPTQSASRYTRHTRHHGMDLALERRRGFLLRRSSAIHTRDILHNPLGPATCRANPVRVISGP